MPGAPYYLLFAGINGAGKSTLFRSGMWEHGPIDASLPRVNSDEILAAAGWDWRDPAAQARAGREAVRLIRAHIAARETFNQETTLSGRTVMRTIERARDAGFRVIMFYVGVENPQIANDRIAHRMEIGGHGIDPAVVERRHGSSISNLVEAIELADEVYLYDNTVLLKLMARFDHGELAYVDLWSPHITWHRTVIERYGYIEIELDEKNSSLEAMSG